MRYMHYIDYQLSFIIDIWIGKNLALPTPCSNIRWQNVLHVETLQWQWGTRGKRQKDCPGLVLLTGNATSWWSLISRLVSMFNFDCHSSLYLSACAGVDLMSPIRKGYGDSMLATPQIARHSPPKKNDGIPSGKKKFQLAKYPVRGWQTARFPKLWPALLLSKSKSPNEHIRRRVLEFRYWRVACNLAACRRIDVRRRQNIL